MPSTNSKPRRRSGSDEINKISNNPRLYSEKSITSPVRGSTMSSSAAIAETSPVSGGSGVQLQQQQKQQLRRFKTEPSTLPSLKRFQAPSASKSPDEPRPKLTKLLLNVTIQGSVGAVQVVISPESTVEDLIVAAVRQHVKEGRRPVLAVDSAVPAGFELHYSQFSLESLEREEEVANLGSRNFFLCRRRNVAEEEAVDGGTGGGVKWCSKEAEESKFGSLPWLKFMNFLR